MAEGTHESRGEREPLDVRDYLILNDALLRFEVSEGGMTERAIRAEDLRQALHAAYPDIHAQAMEQRRLEVYGDAEVANRPMADEDDNARLMRELSGQN